MLLLLIPLVTFELILAQESVFSCDDNLLRLLFGLRDQSGIDEANGGDALLVEHFVDLRVTNILESLEVFLVQIALIAGELDFTEFAKLITRNEG
jgi:hypothetical protein